MVLVELVPTFSPGLYVPLSNCYNTCQCTAAVAATPWSSSCFFYGRESLENLTKEREQTDRRILATLALWNVVNLPLLVVRAAYAAYASGLCCLCQPPHRGREIDEDSER